MPYRDPGTPPLTSPQAYLGWVARGQLGLVLSASAWGTCGFVATALLPYLLGRVLDHGLQDGPTDEVVRGVLVLLAVGTVGVLANVVEHRRAVENWVRAAFRSAQLLGHHVTRTGDAVTVELPTGEVVSTVASDSLRVGEVFWIVPRLLGAVAAYLVVAVLLLRSSVPLGVAVLIGLPAVAAVLGLVVRPLTRRESGQREAAGRLTTLGADTVSGLRILRGIGGEEAFAARYREQSQRVRTAGVAVARTQSLLDGLTVLLPGLLLAGIVWFGARLAAAGTITPGQLVTFYGYAAFLTGPLDVATDALRILTRGVVGVRRMLRVLAVPTTGAEHDGPRPAERNRPLSPDPSPAARLRPAEDLVDERSGLRVRAGRLTALVSADPDESAALAVRLGVLGAEHRIEDSLVRLGGTRLAERGLAEVRRRIVVAESAPHLFTGRLRSGLDRGGDADDAALLSALATADAGDVLDSVPHGLDGEIEEKGRSLSGGQRQRLALARALLTEAEVLVLVEPTSAVDAHTESRIAQRLGPARAGRTTVVVTASPLVLEHADEVALIDDGRVVARGDHHSLLTDDGPAGHRYRAVVSRAEAEDSTEEEENRAPSRR
ncbi:ABC transporter transmembrane domain-containing protein [Actinotalea sp.]|uniref:ABC transporter transmembrane domain-containing protein n=1 Tax=Actinotalea sp. TaxID=1872145 RepID=UPI0035673397